MIRTNGTGGGYRIVVRSELSERYACAFEGMHMETEEGLTILTGAGQRPAAPPRHPEPPVRLGAGTAERRGPAGCSPEYRRGSKSK